MQEIKWFRNKTPWILRDDNQKKFFNKIAIGLLLWCIWFIFYINSIGLLSSIINYFKWEIELDKMTESQANIIIEKLANIEIILACNSEIHNLMITNTNKDKYKDIKSLHIKNNEIVTKIIEDNNE